MSVLEADDRVATLLEAAARLWAASRYCWLATPGEEGGVTVRPMGRTPPAPGDEAWRPRFVTDWRSLKVAEIWRDPAVAITAQRDADDAYLRLSGEATIYADASQDPMLWREVYGAYFPGEGDLVHAAFLEVRVERIDLWMRGVTPEPVGMRAATLVREKGGWELAF